MKKTPIVIISVCVLFIIFFSDMVNGSEQKKDLIPINILAGIDSLTNGRLYSEDPARYLDDFKWHLQKKFGNGGPGYVPFDTRYFNQEGGVLKLSSHLKEINNLPHNAFPARYSFDFKGLYASAGRSESVVVGLDQPWEHAKIFFLKQFGGGTFTIDSEEGRPLTVKTNGRLGLGVVHLPESVRNQPLVIKNITGNVVLFGGYFYNSSGVTVSRVGQGGDRLEWYAGLDRQMQKEWIQALQPDMFIFNGGMNDRTFLTSYQYSIALEKYLNPFRESHCQLVMSIPNAILGDQSRLNEYDGRLHAYSKKYRTGLFSYKSALGDTYQVAFSNGYMEDHIHPSAKGAKVISQKLLNYIFTHEIYQQVFMKK